MPYVIGPKSSLPLGVIRFFNKTAKLRLKFIKLPSAFTLLNLVITIKALDFFPFANQLSGLTCLTETLTKLPTLANLCLDPL